MRKIILNLLSVTTLSINAAPSDYNFKQGTYAPVTKSEGCEETTLEWEQDMLIFGNHRFADLNKEEVKFEGAAADEKDRSCDLYWKATSEGKNKVIITQTTKCPAGSKYDSTDITKQSLTQNKNKLTYEASVAKNGEVVGSSKCVYNKKPDAKK